MSRDLERHLVEVGRRLDTPAGDDIAATVSARLRAEHGAVVDAGSRRRPPRWALAAAAVAVVGAAVAAPAVADWVGVRGVEVRTTPSSETTAVGPRTTTPATTPAAAVPGAGLDLGEPSTLAAAGVAAGFAPVVPARLGPPDAVWLDRRGTVPFVSLVYADGPMVSQFDASIPADAVLTKMAGPATKLEQMRIDGARAMWIEGVHEVVLRAPDGTYVPDRLRISDDVLLLERGRLTIRIETSAGRDEAIAIARSLPSR